MTRERGQIALLTALILVVALALVGLSVDYSYLVYSKQKIQAAADLAALAGAQNLPNTTQANTSATSYFQKNYGNMGSITQINFFNNQFGIKVHFQDDIPLFFMKIFGFPSVTIAGKAEAIAEPLSKPKSIIPIAIFHDTPLIYGVTTDIWGDLALPINGNFGIIDPTNDASMQNKDLEPWIREDYKGEKGMPAANEWVFTKPGLTEGPVTKAFNDRIAIGNKYVICPVVNMSKVNGSGKVPVLGFAYFEGLSCTVTGTGVNKRIIIVGIFKEILDNKGLADKQAGYYGVKSVRLSK